MKWFGCVIGLLMATVVGVPAQTRVAGYVDPTIGSRGPGHVFTGPSMPFGMMKPGPDVGRNDTNPGWAAEGEVNGFSQTHVSGTGGGAKYGNILVQPITGEFSPDVNISSPRTKELQQLGRYRVHLDRFGVDVDLTSSERAAIYTFDYHGGASPGLVIDVQHCLSSSARNGEDQRTIGSAVEIVSAHEFQGSTTVEGGWNKQVRPYTVYFAAMTDADAQSYGTVRGTQSARSGRVSRAVGGERNLAWLQFPKESERVHFKIGISFVSVAQARSNLLREIPLFDSEQVHRDAIAAWNRGLGKLTFEGASDEQMTMLYTALYHTMLMPVDRTGENPLWPSTEPYYDDFYAIWDTYRTSSPLLTLVAPARVSGMLQSLLDTYEHDGWLPDARTGNSNGRTQGGSNAEIMLADAASKDLPGIDWQRALKAAVHDAEDTPRDQLMQGRGGVEEWKTLGYVSVEGVDRSGSKQMEYAADDYAVAVLAAKTGNATLRKKYLLRSGQWEKLWNPDLADGGFRGFIQPRHRDGTWYEPFTALSSCTWGGDTFYEGNSWTYSFFVPQDERAVMEKMGGADAFVRRLDAFFAVPGRYDVGNEPGFLDPYLYLWAGRQDRTAATISHLLRQNFRPTPAGLPGNDDSGAMSAWWLLGMLGFYPNAGQDVYLIGSPQIPVSRITLGNGKQFTVRAEGLSERNLYIASATLNGAPLHRGWFRHRELMQGGTLLLRMTDHAVHWDDGEPPPSVSPR